MNSYELAWCAGFFDGEGSIHYYKVNNGTRRIDLAVVQKSSNDALLHRFQEAVQVGKVYTSKGNSVLRTTKLVEVEHVFMLLSPWLGDKKRFDFLRAIESYKQHEVWMDKCPKCQTKWNQIVCNNCGHVG